MKKPAEKILVRGVNWLGDAVMTTPALTRLREAKPEAEIVLLTPAKLADLWVGHPAIQRVISFESTEGVLSIARRLRAERFSTALVFPNSPRSALEMFLARIPARVGYARPWRNWWLTRTVHPRSDEVRMHKRSAAEIRALTAGERGRTPVQLGARAHHVYQYLHLAAELGARPEAVAPCIVVRDDEWVALRRRFGALLPQEGETRLIGINPGAEYGPAKRWPAERFIQAAAKLYQAKPSRFWLLGGPGDRDLAERIELGLRGEGVPAANIVSLAGRTSLRELCVALKACRVLLTNDTGPMHVAAAVGTPVVAPFGSTSWELTGPGLPGDSRHRFIDSQAPCAPCFLRECPIDFRCMTGIEVSQVVDAVEDLLRSR